MDTLPINNRNEFVRGQEFIFHQELAITVPGEAVAMALAETEP
jgi:hypothetical protein